MSDQPEPNNKPFEIVPSSIELVERAQIDMQIATAKKYPRSMSKVKQDMLSLATLDEETASACFYTLPRGGRTIQGPSVRLAEIAVASYSNLRIGARILHTAIGEEDPHVIVQAVAHDLEKNTAITIEKRRRITKKKSKDRIDDDDITLACNACTAIAFRDAVFKIVPQALIKPVTDAAKKCAVGEVKSLTDKRQKVVDRLKQMGLTDDRILASVEVRRFEDIGLEQLETLIGLGTAIKDGDLTLEQAFPTAAQRVKNREEMTAAAGTTAEAKISSGTVSVPASTMMGIGGPTPQQALAKVVTDNGLSFDDYRKVGIESEWFKGHQPDTWESFDMVPTEIATDHVAAHKFIVKKIKGGK